MSKASPLVVFSSLIGVFFLFAFGIHAAQIRGGTDFNVFYSVFQCAINNQGVDVYRCGPDRYLYAPGFAWIFSPFGYLSRDVSLFLWNFLKSILLFFATWKLIQHFGQRLSFQQKILSLSLGFFGISRALLIDLQYGQVNGYILASGMLAFYSHFRVMKIQRWKSFLTWFVFAITSFAKIFTVPLLIVPFFAFIQKRFKGSKVNFCAYEQLGVMSGIAVLFLSPLLTENFSTFILLYQDWQEALVHRGFPTESHNQSFAALLFHYFSGEATRIMAYGEVPVTLGWNILNSSLRTILATIWSFVFIFFLGFQILQIRELDNDTDWEKWFAVALALTICPLYLVWKPYFIFGLPLWVLLIKNSFQSVGKSHAIGAQILFWSLFAIVNLTSVDFVGYWLAGRIESASVFLIAHIVLLAIFGLKFRRNLPI